MSEHGHHHPHPHQPDLEDSALSYHMALTEALGELLIEKEVFGSNDLRATIEDIDSRSPADGARLVARAWVDESYRRRVLDDVNAAAAELGIDAGGIPIRAVASSSDHHQLVVCTLCSCYPRLLIGLPPDWYKSRAFRSRAVREPRAVLREFGLDLPRSTRVTVHDSTADMRYIVIPHRPPATAGWNEAELSRIVTRDCMIGTAVPMVK